MTVPDIALDELRFQPLVNECRARIAALCPEWTETNVSDPGVTLIELFAWMVDQLSYRINRIPEKLHLALLALLGVQLQPPSAATAAIRFRLGQTAERIVHIPARTEVATRRLAGHEPVVFQTMAEAAIGPVKLTRCLLKRSGHPRTEFVDVSSSGVASPTRAQRLFGTPKPAPGDQLLLGFDEAPDGLIIRINVECAMAEGINVDPKDPPLSWEAFTGEPGSASTGDNALDDDNDGWKEVDVLADTTRGFNVTTGLIELALPDRMVRHSVKIDKHGWLRHFWVRCKVINPESNYSYSESPQVSTIDISTIGATIWAEHAERIEDDALGQSDGTPGQVFRLRRAPLLKLANDEGLRVLPARAPDWEIGWEHVDGFESSGAGDRHYRVDYSTGEVEFGPAVREIDGSFRHYGMAAPPGAKLKFASYRHGGGSLGNVAENTLTQLLRPIPEVRSVSNPIAASGGVDVETLASARARAAIEWHTRNRAITVRDFEELCRTASPRVARAHSLEGETTTSVRVLVVPSVDRPLRALTERELKPQDQLDPLLPYLKRYLDARRLVGVDVKVEWAKYRGVSVVIKVTADPGANLALLQKSIEDRLYTYLNPIIGGAFDGVGKGWDFGREFRSDELRLLIQSFDGVKEITKFRTYETNLRNGQQLPEYLKDGLVIGKDELIASGTHTVSVERAPRR
jgi:predicted phage baseplate assembly protein